MTSFGSRSDTRETDQVVDIPEACRRLANIDRATFYRLPFFKTRKVRVSPGRVGIRVSDIELYLHLQSRRSV